MDQQDGSLTTFVCAFHEDDNIAQHMEIRERGGRGRRDTRKNLPSFFFFPESTELLHWMRGISPGAGRHPGHGGLGRRGDETQALPPPPWCWGRSVCCDRPVDERLMMPELVSRSPSGQPPLSASLLMVSGGADGAAWVVALGKAIGGEHELLLIGLQSANHMAVPNMHGSPDCCLQMLHAH